MSNHLKKHGFSLNVTRLFTRSERDAFDLIHFREPELTGEEATPALTCPDHWSAEAASILSDEAMCRAVPAQARAIEENTVPSWLWRHIGEGKATVAEISVQQIFNRVVGAAIYNGWKQGLFAGEGGARNFYDELRYALAQRFIAIEPTLLSMLGTAWAYGLKKPAPKSVKATAPHIDISNNLIDAIVSGRADKNVRAKWQKVLTAKSKNSAAELHFTDIAADWGTTTSSHVAASIDVMAFRHNDGTVNIEMLRHATRLLTVLLDLHDQPALSIGCVNLAPLLLALGLRYDSDAARTMAAAIVAIITAEAYATSAELAGQRGASDVFTAHREITLRSLRNHRRTAYGDRNDFEKISVIPVSLSLEHCPDLALVAAAQRGWDKALELTKQNGLRQIDTTTLSSSPNLALFMESFSQGIEPLRTLTVTRTSDDENFHREIHPSVTEALMRLGYSHADSQGIVSYIVGTPTLEKAPGINHIALRKRGFDDAALERLEGYLPSVSNVRLAFTSWILGEEFCRKVLKISAQRLRDPRFDLLKQLGFSQGDIAAANAFCYGHDTAKGTKYLKASHAAVFALAEEMSAEVKVKMAASVQSFISGNVALHLSLPVNVPMEKKEQVLLSAWRQGVKSLSITYDAAEIPAIKTKPALSAFLHTKRAPLPARKARMKAGNRVVSMKHVGGTKHAEKNGKR